MCKVRPTDRPTDIVTYRAAIVVKKIISIIDENFFEKSNEAYFQCLKGPLMGFDTIVHFDNFG